MGLGDRYSSMVERKIVALKVVGSSPIIYLNYKFKIYNSSIGYNSIYYLFSPVIRGMAQLVARLFWEQEAMCSSHIFPSRYKFNL